MVNAMKPTEFRAKLGGVIAFPVTPFKADLSLDIPGLRKNLKALVKHKLCAIVAAAGTGELYSLTPAGRKQLARETREWHATADLIAAFLAAPKET